MAILVEQVEPSRTYALRQQVLRPHQTVERMGFPGEEVLLAATFAAVDQSSGSIVSTAAVQPEAPPWVPGSPTYEAHSSHAPYEVPQAAVDAAAAGTGDAPVWRLRGMATLESVRGQGVGRRVLETAIDHVARHGGRLLWCNARVRAIPFYERAGFAGLGELFDEPDVPQHLVMWRAVPPPAGAAPGSPEGAGQ